MRKLILILCLLLTSTAQAQFMPPLPAPFIPKPIMRKLLPAMAQRHRWQKKPMELKEIHVCYDPYSPHDARWMKQFKQDLETPWSETILKTNAYYNASPQGKEAWLRWAKKMDERVKEIREQVTIEKHEATKLAYCINSKYGPWIDLPRGKQPYPTFWLRFVEYHYQDYSWEDHEEYYEHSIQDTREAIWQVYFDKWVVEWARKKNFTTRPQDINSTDFSVQFYGLPNYYGYGTFYSNCDYCLMDGCNEWCLEDEGFKPPAIADKPRPKKLNDPETFMLLGENDE